MGTICEMVVVNHVRLQIEWILITNRYSPSTYEQCPVERARYEMRERERERERQAAN